MKKRIFSFVLAVLMIASLLPATALAADIVDSGTCGAEGDGSNLTWTLDSEGTLTISGTGAMKDYTYDDAAPWKNAEVKTVVMDNGVTSIGNFAFFFCGSLTDIVIPDSVTSIGDTAFTRCESLTGVTIPSSVTRIGNGVFNVCTSLTDITIPEGVTSIGDYTFHWCSNLTGVTIPEGVTSIGDSAFSGCPSLADITVPNGVTSIGSEAFLGCKSLTSMVIPDSVVSIGDHAFYGCANLAQVSIPDGIASISDWLFYSCTSLKEISIPAGVTAIGEYAFFECTGLEKISIPDGVLSIGTGTFSDCTSLKEITIPAGVTSIGDFTFSNCASLKEIIIPDGVTSIGSFAFNGCDGLVDVTIPAGVEKMSGAFVGCKNLATISVVPENVHFCSLSGVVYSKDQKTIIAYPAGRSDMGYTIPDGVTSIDNFAFSDCINLAEISIPDTVTAVGRAAFSSCDSLKDVYFLGTKDAWQKVSIESENEAITENATIHYFSEWTREKEPTCTETGSETSTCSEADCGKTFTHEIPALGHGWDEGKVTKPATETETGTKTFTCTRCSETKTETIPKLTHEHSYKAIITAPACTAKGYTTHTCACGDSYVDTYTDALGHAWDGGKVTKAATETEDGVKTFACTRCSETKTETIPKLTHEHSYKAIITAPACTAKGYTTHTCACGDSYVDTYTDALGHAWDGGKVTKAATETEDGVKTFTCTRCSETKTETIPATGSVNITEMFTDVSHSWADDGIQYCVTHQLMSGVGGNLFAPKMTTTRAQIVQILYNLEGEPKVSGTMPFTDLTQNWYKDAVLWAYQTGVVVGTSATTFEPDRPVTREQIAVILMEYVTKVLKLERTWTPADLSVFPDAGSVSDWAKDALADAVALGLISGASNGGQTLLEPQGSATREQVATILMEFCKNVKK